MTDKEFLLKLFKNKGNCDPIRDEKLLCIHFQSLFNIDIDSNRVLIDWCTKEDKIYKECQKIILNYFTKESLMEALL